MSKNKNPDLLHSEHKLQQKLEEVTSELEELQNRLRIEAALEKVRAAAMAMHKSDDLPEVASIFLGQIEELGIPVFGAGINEVDFSRDSVKTYFADNTVGADKTEKLIMKHIQLKGFWLLSESLDLLKQGKTEYTIVAEGKRVGEWIDWVAAIMSPERATRLRDAKIKNVLFHFVSFHEYNNIILSSTKPLSNADWTIMRKMAKTFGMAYRRFLDLQRAEKQARDANIEASLERIRAASMAMHNSVELPDVALVLVDQLALLEIDQLGSSIVIISDDQKTYCQYSAHDSLIDNRKILNVVEDLDGQGIYLGEELLRRLNEGERDFTISLNGDNLVEWMTYVKNDVHEERGEAMLSAGFECIYFHFAVFHDMSPIAITTLNPLPDTDRLVMRRMADTFGMSYRRYLDLKEVEAQAKEAKIEVALERVRSRSMAMHTSEEITEAATVLFHQLRGFGYR